MTYSSRSLYERWGKPLMDRTLAAVGLIVLSPVIGTVAALVRTTLSRPVFFRQTRPGEHGRPFEMVKFRTMKDARDATGELLPDADRLTSFGVFLRKTSLDELPELWNVLKGDMSLVGPRPLLMEYLPRYTPEQARRHDVRPGITGWAQLHGRNEASWEEQLALDAWYVDHRSLWLDLRILAATIPAVLSRRGISQAEHATRERFGGSDA